MEFNELSDQLKDAIIETKRQSPTIKNEIDKALREAQNEDEFKELIKTRMLWIIAEIRDTIENIWGQ